MYPLNLSLPFLLLTQKWSCDGWLYEGSLRDRDWKDGQPLLAVSGQQEGILLSKLAVLCPLFPLPSSVSSFLM